MRRGGGEGEMGGRGGRRRWRGSDGRKRGEEGVEREKGAEVGEGALGVRADKPLGEIEACIVALRHGNSML